MTNTLLEVNPILIIKEVEYAIKILDALYHNGSMSAAALSKEKDIPSPFIYRILKKLEAGGILTIKRGPKGGYALNKDCSELTLYDVINAFENTFLVVECMKKDYDCARNKDPQCCMHQEFGRIQGLLGMEFRKNSLEDLLNDKAE